MVCLRVEKVEFSLHALRTNTDVVITLEGSSPLSKMSETEYCIKIPVGLEVRPNRWVTGSVRLEGS